MYIRLAILLTILALFYSGCAENESTRPKPAISVNRDIVPPEKPESEKSVEPANKKLTRTLALRKQLVGLNLNEAKNKFEFATFETLDGTSSQKWLVYEPVLKITLLVDKGTDRIINACDGQNRQLIHDQSILLLQHVGKKYTIEEFRKYVNAGKFGRAERPVDNNCLNKNCIEYFPEKNFTTLTYYESSNEGDFAELKLVAMGKVLVIDQITDQNFDEYFLNEVETPTMSEYSKAVASNPEFKNLREGSVVVGKWFVRNKYVSTIKYQTELREKDGRYYEVIISSEKPSIKELKKVGNKFMQIQSSQGDYLVIENKQLKYYDKQGLIDDYITTTLE